MKMPPLYTTWKLKEKSSILVGKDGVGEWWWGDGEG